MGPIPSGGDMQGSDHSRIYTPYSHGNPQHVNLEDVDKITPADYGWTAATIKQYMYGIKVVDPETGQELGDKFYDHIIETAIARAEKELDIAILPRLVENEHHDFHSSDFASYMFTSSFLKPIIQAEDLKLEINGWVKYKYPADWWKVYNLAGHIELYPTALMQSGMTMNYNYSVTGFPQLAGLPPANQNGFAPQMIDISYVAGLLPRKHQYAQEWECPADLEQLVIKIAAKEIFQVWGRLIIGAGIEGKTLSVDGVSESIQTTQSAMYGGAYADIRQIDEDIQSMLAGLKSYFGMNMGII